MKNALLNDLKQRGELLSASLGDLKVRPAARAEDISTAENVLGIHFPSFFKELLRDVGNGGFGPGYGIMGVALSKTGLGVSLEETYHAHLDWCGECNFDWPKTLLPLIDYGCGIYLCLDCSDDNLRIFDFDPNHEMEETDPKWLEAVLHVRNENLIQELSNWLFKTQALRGF